MFKDESNVQETFHIACIQDTVFNWGDFVRKNNTELLNNLGNFINRTLVFLESNFSRFVMYTSWHKLTL